jgi:Na+-driven multidrug efflux pump
MAMVYDVTLQLMGSITVYVAAFESLPTLYQLSAAGAALPQYTAYASGVSFMCKIVGSGLIGHGSYDRFRKFMNGMFGVALLLGLVAFVAIYPFRTAISATYAIQSCGFAYSQNCLGVYRNLFGHEGIDITFEIFTFSACFTCITAVARAGLYACQDFAFMAKASVVAFVLVFLPTLLIARFAFESAAALYLAANLPGWFLTVVFLLRLQYNTRKMIRDERGPWSPRAEVVASLNQSLDPSRAEHSRVGSSRISSFPVLL